MIDLVSAKKIIGSIPDDTLLNFPHPGKKLAIDYSWEDENFYVFDIYAIPKSMDLKSMTERQKDKYVVIPWRIDKQTGLAEEWLE